MKKFIFTISCLFSVIILSAQTLQSPEQFLHYKIGTHFTPHYKILSYFNAVAKAQPDMVKIEKYGETYEGRDLEVAFIGLPENLQRLEDIRLNNLRLAGMLTDKAATTDNIPAIVWLSYNVHGNEPASSEAAMLTLYALVNAANTQTKEWLKNTIVIIDPCMNPDGRDRYVNWYNTAVGTIFNADKQAREHQEPWPYGRTNHYNFDLNRDWAWQTQQESQQRLKLYNNWLPQVHVDYHEQGYNAPYYFAPAAEPMHEVITQWQKDFQVTIGKNHAKYFDENGWLYFTKQEFDLFYPSYGDTYPLYNGAIGMTYEQGGIGAGLGIKTRVNDTLTLVDRTLHHYTTSMSTIETSAKNATRLISEYKKFFEDARNAVNMEYKTYVLTTNNAAQLQAVANLLDENKIQYGTASNKTFKGYNYFSEKEEAYSNEGYQLAVSAFQPKGKLLKVLFEPKSNLTDSNTYDITAWSIPFSYGIQAYAVKDKLDIAAFNTLPAITPVSSNYGLLIPYNSLSSAQVLAYLLQHNVKVRFPQKPFTYNNKVYERGTLMVLKGNNVSDWNKLTNEACAMYHLQPDEVESGFVEKGSDFGSADVRFIKAPNVAMLTGTEVSSSAAGEVWSFFDQTLHYPLTQLMAEDIEDIDLDKYDVLIIPDGYYTSLKEKDAGDKLENFVRQGGKIIAMENGCNALANWSWSGIKPKDNDDNDSSSLSKADYSLLKNYGDEMNDYITRTVPGAIYKLDLDNTHPLGYGYPKFYYTLKQDTRLFNFLKDGWNVGTIKTSNYTSGFVGSKVKPKLKDGTLIGESETGRGSIVFFADDPLFRLFWQNGKLIFSSAVFLAGQ